MSLYLSIMTMKIFLICPLCFDPQCQVRGPSGSGRSGFGFGCETAEHSGGERADTCS